MTALFAALAAGIVAYIIFVMAVPKAVPKESGSYVQEALDRLIEENQAAEAARREVLRDQLSETSPIVQTIFGLGFMRPMYEAGLQAGYQNNLQKLLILMLLAFGATMTASLLLKLGPLGFILALAMAYVIPYRHCKKIVRKRNYAFISQFPDALDMIVRSVRSGFPLSVALQMLAENAEEPVKSEFRQVVDEVALGRSLNQALARLATRINEPDVHFFVVVLSVQQETGGNLGEIISNLSNIIRKRKQIRHKLKAMTSEGKATGYILGALPVFVFVALWFLQPGYLDPFFEDSLGRIFLMSTVGLLVTCYFVIKQMINVEI